MLNRLRPILLLWPFLFGLIVSGCGGKPAAPPPASSPAPDGGAAIANTQAPTLPSSPPTSAASPVPAATTSSTAKGLIPAPAWSPQTQAFWQELLDALNSHDAGQIARYVDDQVLSLDIMDFSTPTPHSTVAQLLAAASEGGTVACVGFDKDSVLLQFPRELQVNGVGNFGSSLVLTRPEGEKVTYILPQPSPFGRLHAYWPCELAGLSPVAQPLTYVLWATQPREDTEEALTAFVNALINRDANAVRERVLPQVAQQAYGTEGALRLSATQAAQALLEYGGTNLQCIGYSEGFQDYTNTHVAQIQVVNFTQAQGAPYLEILLVPDNDGRYKVSSFMSIPAELYNPAEQTGISGEPLRPCPAGLPVWDLSAADQACQGSPRRLQIGEKAFVCTQSDAVALRAGPGKAYGRIRRMPPGTEILVTNGPTCDQRSGMWYWEVQTDSGQKGWMAEGGDAVDPYYLCPKP